MRSLLTLSLSLLVIILQAQKAVQISGELKKWHKVTLTLEGPTTSEQATDNPFLNYRLEVIFSNGENTYKVPGYFAADGKAAETSSSSGNKWRVHFSPDRVGEWTYQVAFRQGENIAVLTEEAGIAVAPLDGQKGTFKIAPTDKEGRDFRAKGCLQYVGKHYLQFAETGAYFLKAGADAPENLLAYSGFDGDFATDGIKDELVKNWQPHEQDWTLSDPTWQNGKGKGIIGALNYLASKGMNAVSFLTCNIKGDDQNVFPYTSYEVLDRIDVSKMDQWEIVFEHAQQLGLFLHFKTQEAENQGLHDKGELGVTRKLYYRELIARFGHHLALNWNLGEENGEWLDKNPTHFQYTPQRVAMADYFYRTDPYHHHIVIHNGVSFHDLLGDASQLTGASVQTNFEDFRNVHLQTLRWRRISAGSGKPWVICVDEPGDHRHALLPDAENPSHDAARKNALWGMFMAGGAGIEWYFGYEHPHSDLTCQDWRSREKMWEQSFYALDFFAQTDLPFWEMIPDDEFTNDPNDYVLYKPNEAYIFYLKKGGKVKADLRSTSGTFEITWFDPKTGKFWSDRTTREGNKIINIPEPPYAPKQDWVVVLLKV